MAACFYPVMAGLKRERGREGERERGRERKSERGGEMERERGGGREDVWREKKSVDR